MYSCFLDSSQFVYAPSCSRIWSSRIMVILVSSFLYRHAWLALSTSLHSSAGQRERKRTGRIHFRKMLKVTVLSPRACAACQFVWAERQLGVDLITERNRPQAAGNNFTEVWVEAKRVKVSQRRIVCQVTWLHRSSICILGHALLHLMTIRLVWVTHHCERQALLLSLAPQWEQNLVVLQIITRH